MKWPWVSRAGFDEAHRQLTVAHVAQIRAEQVASAHDERAKRAEKQYDDLLARYHMLKLNGASEPTPERAAIAKPDEDPVIAAVNAACAGKDAKVRSAMLKQVTKDRKADISDADIILRIQRGNRPAEEMT